jgi:hypothetical protein
VRKVATARRPTPVWEPIRASPDETSASLSSNISVSAAIWLAVFHLPMELTAIALWASPPAAEAHYRNAEMMISREMMTMAAMGINQG